MDFELQRAPSLYIERSFICISKTNEQNLSESMKVYGTFVCKSNDKSFRLNLDNCDSIRFWGKNRRTDAIYSKKNSGRCDTHSNPKYAWNNAHCKVFEIWFFVHNVSYLNANANNSKCPCSNAALLPMQMINLKGKKQRRRVCNVCLHVKQCTSTWNSKFERFRIVRTVK